MAIRAGLHGRPLRQRHTSSDVQIYLRDASGNPVFAGGPFNIGGAALHDCGYRVLEQRLRDRGKAGGTIRCPSRASSARTSTTRVVATTYDDAQSEQRLPTTALPTAYAGGTGAIVRGDGTGWDTLDAKGVWRVAPGHELSFGAHGDRYELKNERFSTTDWINGAPGAPTNASRGKTEATGIWVQDAWDINDAVTLVVGGRYAVPGKPMTA